LVGSRQCNLITDGVAISFNSDKNNIVEVVVITVMFLVVDVLVFVVVVNHHHCTLFTGAISHESKALVHPSIS
jgi:hypothetical protein